MVAATKSRDERELLLPNVNSVWTGHKKDRERDIAAVRHVAINANFVIYYHHYQIHDEDFDDIAEGRHTRDGHLYVDSVDVWQEAIAREMIDAASNC